MAKAVAQEHSTVQIKSHNVQPALDALNQAFGTSWRSLETPLRDHDWGVLWAQDGSTDVESLVWWGQHKQPILNERDPLVVIAPFVEPGSCIRMRNKAGETWRWEFDGTTVTTVFDIKSQEEQKRVSRSEAMEALAIADALITTLMEQPMTHIMPYDQREQNADPARCILRLLWEIRALQYSHKTTLTVSALAESLQQILDALDERDPGRMVLVQLTPMQLCSLLSFLSEKGEEDRELAWPGEKQRSRLYGHVTTWLEQQD